LYPAAREGLAFSDLVVRIRREERKPGQRYSCRARINCFCDETEEELDVGDVNGQLLFDDATERMGLDNSTEGMVYFDNNGAAKQLDHPMDFENAVRAVWEYDGRDVLELCIRKRDGK